MTDREKVIKGLKCCVGEFSGEKNCKQCQYRPHKDGCKSGAIMDAIALLKAQEPVSVQRKPMKMVGLQTWDWACGNCGQTVLFSAKFCPWCGRAVKWE